MHAELSLCAELWAMCLRTDINHGGLDTTGHCEGFHSGFKADVRARGSEGLRADHLISTLVGSLQKWVRNEASYQDGAHHESAMQYSHTAALSYCMGSAYLLCHQVMVHAGSAVNQKMHQFVRVTMRVSHKFNKNRLLIQDPIADMSSPSTTTAISQPLAAVIGMISHATAAATATVP